MNEEATSEAQAAPDSTEPPAASPPAPSRGGLPPWLPYFFLAVVPAVVVGILVYVFAGSSSGGGNAAGILEAFLVPTEDSNTRVDSYKDSLPDDFPEFPLYEGADPIVSFSVVTPESTTYRAILTTDATASDVFNYYQDVLDKDPWQVEIGQTGAQVTGIQFTRPDNADVSGVIIVQESDIDEVTVIQLIYEDLSAPLAPGTGPSVPLLGESRPLPPGFPESVPIYGADDGTTVIDSGFQRGAGGQVFIITFLTQDTPDDVIEFYRSEFEAQDWTVDDSENTDTTSFAIGIEFADDQQATTGFIVADTYEEDASYTRVDLQVQVSNAARPN
jgi:hypothetical protein